MRAPTTSSARSRSTSARGRSPASGSERAVKEIVELKLFAVVPGDLIAERDRIRSLVEAANRTLSDSGVAFRFWHYRAELAPGLHPEAPEALLRAEIDGADVVLIVGWNDLGKLGDDVAAMLVPALERWKERGTPRVWPFRCVRPARLDKAMKLAALRLEEAYEALARIASIVEFETADQLADRLMEAVLKLGLERAPERAKSTLEAHVAEAAQMRRHLENVRAKH